MQAVHSCSPTLTQKDSLDGHSPPLEDSSECFKPMKGQKQRSYSLKGQVK